MSALVFNLATTKLTNVLEVSVVFNNHLYDCNIWQPHLNNVACILLLVFAHLICIKIEITLPL